MFDNFVTHDTFIEILRAVKYQVLEQMTEDIILKQKYEISDLDQLANKKF